MPQDYFRALRDVALAINASLDPKDVLHKISEHTAQTMNCKACTIRLLDSTVCFVCSHLAAHRENVAGRNADFHKWVRACGVSDRICDNLRFKPEGEEGEGVGVMDHDLVFWVG